VAEQVLAIVAEKTGYPQEMLDLDLDMEADLGIDTVKQAETFMAIREAFGIPRQDDLKLRDYPTLASVIEFVYTNRPDLVRDQGSGVGGQEVAVSGQPSAVSPQPATGQPEPSSSVLRPSSVTTIGTLADADSIPRRVPVPSLRPALEFCKPTGVTLDGNTRVVVMMDRGGVGRALLNRLDKRGVGTLVIDEPLTTEDLELRLKGWLAEGPIQGVYWLPALDVEPGIEEMDLAIWRELNRQRVKNLYTTMRTLYETVSGPGAFLVSATRLGGLHGYTPEGATAPLGGAVVGFTKAYKREKGDTLVKAVDFEAGRKTAEPAEALIAETLFDPGIVEIGYFDGLRYTVTLEEQPAADGQPGMVLNKETVFVVTGAAGGITSAIVADLAVASGGVFYLLDLVPLPERNNPDIALFRTDKEALKRKLFDAMKAAGERPTPVAIDKRLLAIEREEAALRAVETVEAAGGTAHYHSVNLMDGAAVTAVVDDIRSRYGRIDVLLHAGGLEISRMLPDKEPREFNLVFDVKADGFFSLLNAAKGLPIGATVSFSSVAGRFGNSGQADYSSANDLLCKISSSMRTWRPETRGIVIDWTAWGGIGMATRGSIPQIMERAGIDMLPPEGGVPTIRRELTYGGTRNELVVGKRLGILVAEFDPTGGLDVEKANAAAQGKLMVGKIVAAKLYGGLEVETTLDPKEQAFLFDHQIDKVPVLPGVMGTEAFAELATTLAGVANGSSFNVAAVKVQFQSPFKFHRNQPRTLYLSATARPGANGEIIARTMLRSVTQPKPEMPAQVALHFTGDVQLAHEAVEQPTVEFTPPATEALGIDQEQIYQVYFHGPAYQVLERVGVEANQAVALMADALLPDTASTDTVFLVAPRLIELCFQAAGIWEAASKGRLGLPLAYDTATVYRRPEDAGGQRLYALVTPLNGGEAYDVQVVDAAGNVYVTVKGYRTVVFQEGVQL
jgi:NAD(P)-dependent dehydrogenase (short-subunit alcohol dehydrogenase family)/acyl carrier protein